MRRTIWLLVLWVVFVAPDHALRAQNSDNRRGFWVNVGLGYGSLGIACRECGSSPRRGGGTLSFYLGATPSVHLRLGVGGGFWLHSLRRGRTPEVNYGGLLASYYPRRRGGLIAEAGIGVSNYIELNGSGDFLEPTSAETTYVSGTGVGLTLALGWDFPSGRRSWGPRLTYLVGDIGPLHGPNGQTAATGWKQNLILLEIVFRGGP